jgi:hypothetical protein
MSLIICGIESTYKNGDGVLLLALCGVDDQRKEVQNGVARTLFI